MHQQKEPATGKGDRLRARKASSVRRFILTVLLVCVSLPSSASAGPTYMTVSNARLALTRHIPTIRAEAAAHRAWVNECRRVNPHTVICTVLAKGLRGYGGHPTMTMEYTLHGESCRRIRVILDRSVPSVLRDGCGAPPPSPRTMRGR